MFIKVPMKIFDYRLSGNEMKVYLYLARIQNDSEITMAKRETIRMRCGLRSNTTVGSILHVLEQISSLRRQRVLHFLDVSA